MSSNGVKFLGLYIENSSRHRISPNGMDDGRIVSHPSQLEFQAPVLEWHRGRSQKPCFVGSNPTRGIRHNI